MGWKKEKGKEVLSSIKEQPGTITINDNKHKATKIRRIEAWDAERILGVRCALDGQDTVEFNYRLEEAKKLAGKIVMAPLTRFDAEVVCRERWMVVIKYCLPITRFSVEQCHQFSIPI